MGVPLVIIHFRFRFSILNHPAIVLRLSLFRSNGGAEQETRGWMHKILLVRFT